MNLLKSYYQNKEEGKNKHNDVGRAAQADKIRGRTKYTHTSIASAAIKRTGEKSAVWRGGASFEPYSPIFNNGLKESIRERDNHKCQECNIPQSEYIRILDIHHIDYIKKNTSPDNLITLCRPCNSKANKNRGYWEIYYKLKIILNNKEQLKLVAWDYSVLNT